jgi:hypothetical protein
MSQRLQLATGGRRTTRRVGWGIAARQPDSYTLRCLCVSFVSCAHSAPETMYGRFQSENQMAPATAVTAPGP